MQKQCISDDSDSDSLPDPETEFYASTSKAIDIGDIVYAKFRYLYWPALIRACYPLENKVSVWYCDEPGKTFKIPNKNIYSFYDKEMSLKIRQDAKDAGVLKEHEGLTSHAMTYLRRRAKGIKDDPMKFFDQTYPFFLAEEVLKKDPTADLSNIKICPMYISHDKKMTVRKTVGTSKSESELSEVESEDSDCINKKHTNDYMSEINARLQENINESSTEIDVDAVPKYILSGKVNGYLKKIMSKEITSEYHNLFEHSIKSNRKNVNKVTYTGPITSDSKLRKLIFYLLPLYEKIENALRNKCTLIKKHKTATSSSFNHKKIGAQYVASVFLPESIIFAISKIKNISLTEAKKFFIGKSKCKTKVVERILKCVNQSFLNSGFAEENPKNCVLKGKEYDVFLKDTLNRGNIMFCGKSNTVYNKKNISFSDSKPNKNVKLSSVVKSN